MIQRKHASVTRQEIARSLDWLTALSPLLLMMVVNYRLAAVWAVCAAAASYWAVTVLWYFLRLLPVRTAPALLCGVLVACCLPASAPVWVAALAGAIGGTVAVIPALVNLLCKKERLYCPVYFPALAGYLAVRYIFAPQFTAFALPVMWAADTAASATPLAALGQSVSREAMNRLFWGFDAGSMGGGPVPAVLLALVFLLIRRRVSPLSAATMAGVVALLSYLLWQQPMYALMAGGTLLAAVLVGDEGFLPVGWKGRLVTGGVAGAVMVLCRLWWGMDGAAVGVLAAGVLTPILHLGYHEICRFIRFLREKFAKSEN